MKTLLILFAVSTTAIGLSFSNYDQWNEFKLKYKKDYATANEEQLRHQIFLKNLKTIQEHNERFEAGLVKYQKGINQFADMTHEEFVATLTPLPLVNATVFNFTAETWRTPIPDQIDWRTKGAVTRVKHQGRCGSCYAFSAVGALEGQFYIKNKKLVSLSEQNLVDCSEKNLNGCHGGNPYNAFWYVHENGGIDTEDSYPYKDGYGKCRYNPKNAIGTVSGAHILPDGDEEALKRAVATIGPISVALNAHHFMHYHKGVYHGSCDKHELGHAALIVGYGTENGLDYWLIKNSWGKHFGEHGYVRLARNHDNLCGIASYASYPVVK